MTDAGFSGNAFEHWEHDVLTGRITFSFFFELRNGLFDAASETEFRVQINDWAASHQVTLREGYALTRNRESRPGVHFTLPS